MLSQHCTTEELIRVIALKDTHIRRLEAQLEAHRWSHLGILSGPAVRAELAQLQDPVDIIGWDWRKLHESNDILGWDLSNYFFGRACRVDYAGKDRRHARRRVDVRGQWAGDEIVWVIDAGAGRGLLARLVRELAILTSELTIGQRRRLELQTGGLINGFAVAAVLVECSMEPLTDADRAVAAANLLKHGRNTGCRATSGARGTVLGRLEPRA